MQTRLKSDLPLTSEILSWFNSLVTPRKQEVTHGPPVPASITSSSSTPSQPASYELKPLYYVKCNTNDPASGFGSFLGLQITRFASPLNLSIAIPSIMSIQPPERQSASASRKRLSDAGSSKIRWLAQKPLLTADHSISYSNKVQKLLLKANLDLNNQKYSGEVVWFAKWEGQPARLRFKWSEGSPSSVLFDAKVALRWVVSCTSCVGANPYLVLYF